jgi:hypothetical protein
MQAICVCRFRQIVESVWALASAVHAVIQPPFISNSADPHGLHAMRPARVAEASMLELFAHAALKVCSINSDDASTAGPLHPQKYFSMFHIMYLLRGYDSVEFRQHHQHVTRRLCELRIPQREFPRSFETPIQATGGGLMVLCGRGSCCHARGKAV